MPTTPPDEPTHTPTLGGSTPVGPPDSPRPAGSPDAPTPIATALPLRPTIPGYEVSGEIARGGMGAILAARELALDREVAIKVLLPGVDTDEAARRFVVESKITAHLPHPGIPPVYAIGELAGGSPFLAMKLIRGRTLAELLRERESPAADLPRFEGVFEKVCEAVGFAHAQGIIHRDLKPQNVMVGAFGEVQVMDWGLAKVLAGRAGGGTGSAPNPPVHTDGPPDPADGTIAGAVLGTPSYMAPEQARGEPADERADVFGLGGILCAVLTGGPTFTGGSRVEVFRRAERGDVSEALGRLDGCGADPELIAACKRCLAPDPAGRPADAGEVARLVAAYRAGVEDRLRTAEAQRVAAEARAESEAAKAAEQRKRRRVQLLLAATVGLLLFGGGAFAWWQDRQAERRRADRAAFELEREFNGRQARQEIGVAMGQSVARRKEYRFREAGEALALAERLAARHGIDDLKPAIDRAAADLAFVRDLDDIRYKKLAVWVILEGPSGEVAWDEAVAAPAYRAAFLARGFDFAAPADAAARLRESDIRAELVDALDDWAVYESDEPRRGAILAVARRVDPDPWKDRFRDPAVRADKARLAELARDAAQAAVPPATLSALGELLRQRGLNPGPLLRTAQTRYPTEFPLAFALGRWYVDRDRDEAVAYYRIALGLRPDNVTTLTNLGGMLAANGALGDAGPVLRRAVDLDPKSVGARINHGFYLAMEHDLDGAEKEFLRATELNPHLLLGWTNLSASRVEKNDLDGAIAALEAAARYRPENQLLPYQLSVLRILRQRAERTAPPPREVNR